MVNQRLNGADGGLAAPVLFGTLEVEGQRMRTFAILLAVILSGIIRLLQQLSAFAVRGATLRFPARA